MLVEAEGTQKSKETYFLPIFGEMHPNFIAQQNKPKTQCQFVKGENGRFWTGRVIHQIFTQLIMHFTS